jgi:drug/metabolite transporter (DMT)-like permease
VPVILLSLLSAVAFGLSDFVGGLLTRRASVWIVAAVSQATATVVALGVIATRAGDPGARDLLWGALAGLGSGAGNVLIYYGLSRGRMAVVAPVSAITTASLPVAVGLITGERPGMWPLLGAFMALPAVWLVSSGGGDAQARPHHRDRGPKRDVLTGLAAGVGFGVQFSALGMVAPAAGLTPLAVSQFVSVGTIVFGAIVQSASWLPRDRFGALASVAGLLAGIATVCFQLAVQQGLLTIAGVLASLYPAVTVLLAAVVLRERIYRLQGAGLMLAAMAIALIAAG